MNLTGNSIVVETGKLVFTSNVIQTHSRTK
uniref:Uncharacterized protein n=1 Tax=CrAss-like virus sp. ctUXy6 TaxID=2825835 RepID=A0A8S5V7E0_9CAUD|nr:MAG TPA: hypothetical protein [CrAss-like virus sp. ctUXy6]